MNDHLEEYRRATERLRKIAPEMAAAYPTPETVMTEVPAPAEPKQDKRSYGNPKSKMRPVLRGDGRIYQRGNRWWIEYWIRGKQYRESAAATEEAAQKKLTARLAEAKTARFIGPSAETITGKALLDAYEADLEKRKAKSPSTYCHLRKMRQFFGADRAIDITETRLDRFIAEERLAKLTDATINRELQTLRAAFRLGWKRKQVRDVPIFTLLREDNVRTGFFEPHEFSAVIAHLPEYYAEAARFAYLTGWRRGEVEPLRWDQIDRIAGEVRLRTSKNGRGRVIPLEGELRDVIERQAQRRAYIQTGSRRRPGDGQIHISELVFHRNGKPLGDWRKTWDRAFEKAGVTRRLFHDFRRTAGRNLTRAGVSETVAMSITGHVTSSMFRRYNITDARDQRAAFQRMGQYLDSQPTETNVIPLKQSAK